MNAFLFFLLVTGGVFLLIEILHPVRYFLIARKLGKETRSFSVTPLRKEKRVLIIGDSTAYGTGAQDPINSVAGRLAREYPQAQIENYAENGLSTGELRKKLVTLSGQNFDLVLIHIGGIDILSFTSLKKIRENLCHLLTCAKALSRERVVLVSAMNVGASSIFWLLGSWLYERRTLQVRQIFIETSRALQVPYVDLYTPRKYDPFVKHPTRYHAPDKIHPNDAGYGLWYEKIRPMLPK